MRLTNTVALDIEIFPNYFLIAFKNADSGKAQSFSTTTKLSKDQRRTITKIMQRRVTFGFNSNNFDIPVLLYALAGSPVDKIKRLSDKIIEGGSPGWMTRRNFNLSLPQDWRHFDLKEPAPGVMVSLKLYGGRMGSRKLRDLPYPPDTELSEAQMREVEAYCVNDLDTTIDLFNAIKPQLQLRSDMSAQYGQDLMSKSDAQIAEAVIRAALGGSGQRPAKPAAVGYTAPDFIKFRSKSLKAVLALVNSHQFELDGRGSVKLPKELASQQLTIGGTTYKIGIGGLHSMEKGQAVVPGKGERLIDKDVASYYPSIILRLGLYPRHLGKPFLKVYEDIVKARLTAKRAGDKVTADSLKIVVNGSFGKLGSPWSILYSPDLMLAVTLTGQLSLLMLIERLEREGIRVVSANTDGFVSVVPDALADTYERLCAKWEDRTGFELEATEYLGLFSRDVNNYLAVKTDGKKGKGIFAAPSLMKNPQTPIVTEAAAEFLAHGTPVAKTIKNCTDVIKFLAVRTVTGGAEWRGQYLGKVVRWYYSENGDPITYVKNGNKVAKSDGAVPMMELDEFPDDMDFDFYINEAKGVLESVQQPA